MVTGAEEPPDTVAHVESPRRYVELLAVPLPSRAVPIVPELILAALVVSVVALVAKPVTADEEIEAAVVSTPDVVVTTICPDVDPMAPAFVMLPWTWLSGVRESDSRESLPTHAVALVVP